MCGKNTENKIETKYENWKNEGGSSFNFFYMMELKMSEEERPHSLFLSELLNPQGSHGCKKKFLEKFLECVPKLSRDDKENFCFEELSNTRIAEYPFFPQESYDGGRFDIILKGQNGKIIIIENKLHSPVDLKQLERYQRFVNEDQSENALMILLTLDSSDKSKEVEEKATWKRISYENIKKWLEDFLNDTNSTDKIQGDVTCIIRQYLVILDSILSKKAKRKGYLHQSIKDIPSEYVAEYIKEKVKKKLNEEFSNQRFCKYGLTLHKCEVGRVDISVKYGKKLTISVHSDNNSNPHNWNDMYIGIFSEENKFRERKLCCLEMEITKESCWPYGYSFLRCKDWQGCHFSNFMEGDVIREVLNYIENIMKELTDRDINLEDEEDTPLNK